MRRFTLASLVWTLGAMPLAGLHTSAIAIEPTRDVFGLWEFENDGFPSARAVSGIDFFPAEPGIEMLGLNDSLSTSSPNGSGNVKTIGKALFVVRNADSGTVVAEYMATTESGLYPDPSGSAGASTTYLCGFELLPVDPTQDEFPCEELFGFGAANVGSTRLFIVGNSFTGFYSNPTDGFVDVSRFRVQAFNLRNGNLRWSKTYRLVDSAGWEIEPTLSAVGDFLNDDGDDEVRIVQTRERPNGNHEFHYRYFDAKFGALIKSTTFAVPRP